MIQKLRIKITAVTMAIACFFLFIIFTTFYYSTKMNYAQKGMEVLQSAMMENRPNKKHPGRDSSTPAPVPAPPGRTPENPPSQSHPPIRENEALLLIADVLPSGEIVVVKNLLSDIETSQVETLIAEAKSQNPGKVSSKNDVQTESAGVLPDKNLRYLAESFTDGNVRYVFGDTSGEVSVLYQQLLHSLVIGACSLAVFFPISLWLSKWMTKPVEEAFNRQRQFVADASHELKTPLTVILSNTGLLLSSNRNWEERNIRRLDNIKAEAGRMKGLVESLLNLARYENNAQPPKLGAVDFSFTANSSILSWEPVIYEAGKELSCHIEESVWVKGHAQKLRQLFDILWDNACKYSEKGSCIQISVVKTSAKEALFSVTSRGTPLTKEEQNQIFFRFYRVSASRSGVPGYGLGLSIASCIVKEHHGKIWVQSGEGENTFFVKLPATLPNHTSSHQSRDNRA